MAYLVLFDSSFNPLGSSGEGQVSSVHVCKSWTLKRKSFEFDEFTAVCRGYKDSKNATYAGLFEKDGTLIYRCLSGIPTTKDGLTTVNGIDVRRIFDQDIPVDYSNAIDKDGRTSVKNIYQYLVGDSLEKMAEGVKGAGVPFATEFLDLPTKQIDNNSEGILSTSKEIRNVWEQIQACNAMFSCVRLAEWRKTPAKNTYSLVFTAKPVFNVYTVRLSDFDAKRTLNQNVTNHVSIWSFDLSSKLGEYFLLKVPEVTQDDSGNLTTYKFTYVVSKYSDKVCLPLVSKSVQMEEPEDTTSDSDEDTGKTYEEDYAEKLATARQDAIQTLLDSVSKDRVTIDRNSKYGKKLEGITLSDMGLLVGYYPADGESGEDKYLPVSAISTDSEGNKKVEFGKLSEYWFME